MQHLGVNFGGIWSVWSWFFFICVFLGYFCLRNLCWFLKVQWQHSLWVRFIMSCFRSRNLKAGLQLSSMIRQLHIATNSNHVQMPFEGINRTGIHCVQFNTRCEKKCSLVSVQQWALTILRECSRVQLLVATWKRAVAGTDKSPCIIMKTSIKSALFRISSRDYSLKTYNLPSYSIVLTSHTPTGPAIASF